MNDQTIKDEIKARYGQAALQAQKQERRSCCGTGTVLQAGKLDPITGRLYQDDETAALPQAAVAASLGCGNPTALASISPGETVLDLGSGGGIDVLLSAKRVGPTGKVYGLDMTDEMLELARANQAKAGVANVEFLKGDIEHIPLPDNSVDLIISNCVINLSPDKDRVLAEAFRVLKPGGRFAVSDIVIRGEMPAEIRRSIELWAGCVAGALEESDYKAKLERAGFEQVSIEPTRVYTAVDAAELLDGTGLDIGAIAPLVDGKFISGFVRATKPMAGQAACCSTTCCS
ncbi:arsenite methyltransferase [Nitrospira moscoviensis]|uniref:Arsenite methyltransferase n=1 Tax=Nitrospira moscoviensis TaxID=42253 RepID=A0A0K2GH19_NITMO|nr:arsenite methyltransferase [Nitrospira moscoviensis]ALA60236.1 putative Arsenite S-adenosylmethyltransferase [Nitrospira moscoviensis]